MLHRDSSGFAIGEMTDKVWAGDIVTKCEYLGPLGGGRMLFRDHTFNCYRAAFWERHSGEFILNGWKCVTTTGVLL